MFFATLGQQLESPVSLPTLSSKRYELLNLLGVGGMASVYRCLDRDTGDIRAIKILDEKLAHKTQVLRRFEQEAAAMDKLDHPNILPLHDVSFESDERFIVMDFVDGESLHEQLSRAPLTPKEALVVLIPVLDALAMAHENDIVHRDIKPHNILLSKTGGVFVSDFGIARCIADTDMSLTQTGVIMGTWAFMAPEQRADSKGVDHLADIYSVGATLFSAVTGQTPKDLFAAELDPTIYEAVPVQLGAVIRRACAYWTTDRYRSAMAMKADLEQTLEELIAGPGAKPKAKPVRLQEQVDDGVVAVPREMGPSAPTARPPRSPQPVPASPPPRRVSVEAVTSGAGLVVSGLAAVVLIGILAYMGAKTIESAQSDDEFVPETIAVTPGMDPIQEVEEPEVVPDVPMIHHEPPGEIVLRDSFYLVAEITGSGAYDKVSAWYRPRGMSDWSRTGLRRVGDEYQGTIDITPMFSKGLEYWIEAKGYHKGVPPLAHGSAGQPVRVSVASN
jgi:predicted Ser/Thr protein kinase